MCLNMGYIPETSILVGSVMINQWIYGYCALEWENPIFNISILFQHISIIYLTPTSQDKAIFWGDILLVWVLHNLSQNYCMFLLIYIWDQINLGFNMYIYIYNIMHTHFLNIWHPDLRRDKSLFNAEHLQSTSRGIALLDEKFSHLAGNLRKKAPKKDWWGWIFPWWSVFLVGYPFPELPAWMTKGVDPWKFISLDLQYPFGKTLCLNSTGKHPVT